MLSLCTTFLLSLCRLTERDKKISLRRICLTFLCLKNELQLDDGTSAHSVSGALRQWYQFSSAATMYRASNNFREHEHDKANRHTSGALGIRVEWDPGRVSLESPDDHTPLQAPPLLPFRQVEKQKVSHSHHLLRQGHDHDHDLLLSSSHTICVLLSHVLLSTRAGFLRFHRAATQMAYLPGTQATRRRPSLTGLAKGIFSKPCLIFHSSILTTQKIDRSCFKPPFDAMIDRCD
jgi:hypothetical protein